jgi:transcriptional regulator with XRE-family HTH domain
MQARDIKQVPLAGMVGVSQPAVSGWLRGAMPDAEQLVGLSNALGVSIDYLLKGIEGIKSPEVRERGIEPVSSREVDKALEDVEVIRGRLISLERELKKMKTPPSKAGT